MCSTLQQCLLRFKQEGNALTSSAFDKTMAKVRSAELALRGAGGEPVDFQRTIASHGVADLPPNRIDEQAWTLELTLHGDGKGPRTVRVSAGRPGFAKLEVPGRAPARADLERLRTQVAYVLRLDEDLTPFYEVAANDPDLSWVTSGAGRLLRSPTVFEDVVKTICTTNCAWSATVRMVSALVESLGEPGPAADGPYGRAFPTPAAMARKNSAFYSETVRAGYRGAYLQALARSVASGELDLEALARASTDQLPDEELSARLLALPGVGPYAAAHVMMLLGRYTPLVLDSWTRPKYLKVSGARSAKDTTIERRFRRYGEYAGLAFWLYLTRDWVDE
jgi:3-methyladenine DNA glycosylase/8-oxoguanine DNA glycosylase